ncbi:hypothetical protein BC828DRAFT_378464 [Blastocladiella britannica]|nr:hypothetical protein BC828DRAFT_378464 [Blastocladiella britannica]
MCIMNGHEDMLDLLLRSTNLLTMDWNCDIVDKAVHGQIDLLEWWDRHRNELPPQNLDCARRLTYPAQQDAVDVLAWWHARGFPATKSDWHRAYSMAISMDARRVILWLRDHPTLLFSESDEEYQPFVDACKTKLSCSKPYTLDIVATIVGDLESTLHPPEKVYTCMATLLWWCSRHNITVASLLPVDPSILDEMVNMRYVVMLDWWVQVHMAAGHRIVFPAANLLDEFCHWTIDTHVWMYDVMVTRKIPVFVQSERGVVPYMPPPLPFSV